MGVEAMRAVHAYRHLLRAVKKHVGKEDHKTHFTDFISQAFRQPSDPSSLHHKLKLATDYTFLLNSVHHHKCPPSQGATYINTQVYMFKLGGSTLLSIDRETTVGSDPKDLLFSYNIAVDRSDEMRRVLGKSAASVGLQLPEVYQP
ncbi:hypothetical protein Acr_00g0009950 [Actinidia rufa]|uniref:Uncharacterized protein n=1 Tax=Actinidia rufa TaxID=165716 RepID=A0A7J0DAQ0_9ERIC|nr:hypothetical protein Acr_00g0009950 [Actinidia rufa]